MSALKYKEISTKNENTILKKDAKPEERKLLKSYFMPVGKVRAALISLSVLRHTIFLKICLYSSYRGKKEGNVSIRLTHFSKQY